MEQQEMTPYSELDLTDYGFDVWQVGFMASGPRFLVWMVKSYWPDGGENDSNQTETIESSGLLSEQGDMAFIGTSIDWWELEWGLTEYDSSSFPSVLLQL